MTSFLPKKWEVSPPQICSRLRWLLLLKPVAGQVVAVLHPSSIVLPPRWTTPSHGPSQGPSYLWQSFRAFCWLKEDQTTGRQWFPSAWTKELVFCLRISVSFKTIFSAGPEEMLGSFRLFVCLLVLPVSNCVLGMPKCFLYRLEISDCNSVPIGKNAFQINYCSTEYKLFFSNIFFWKGWCDKILLSSET